MNLASKLPLVLTAITAAFGGTGCAVTSIGGERTAGSAETRSASEHVTETTTEVDAASGLDLRVEAWSDFYFLIRAQAGGILNAEPELQPVIDAWLPVQEHVGTFGGFWRFDLPGMLSSDPEEFASWFEDAPERVLSRAGDGIPIRAQGIEMARAMLTVWPRFLGERWPERRATLDDIVRRLGERFMPRHRKALRFMLDSLGIDDPKITVPTYLVLDTHAPGASTYRSRGGPVAVLSTRELLDEGRFSDLEETLLHETCHALDLASEGDRDAFSILRRVLEERGVTPSDRRFHDIPHLVMFVQAENTMRRLYNEQHIAYGDTWRGDIAPLYERSGEAAVVVRREWGEYLDGKLGREEALLRIVDELVPL